MSNNIVRPPAQPQATRRPTLTMRIRLTALIAFWCVFVVVVSNRICEFIEANA